MARTYRTPENKRKKYWQKETKPQRKQSNKQKRLQTKQALLYDCEVFPIYKGTEGWLTH